jgi:hypothetical protein
MIDDRHRRSTGPLPVEARAPHVEPDARSRPGLLVRELEDLRDRVLQKLDSIEGLARSRGGAGSAEIARLEQTLKQRLEALEVERRRLRSGAEQGEASWKQMLGQLESDRRLLSEAWERLERERIELAGSATTGHHRSRPTDSHVSPSSPAPPPAAHRTAPAADAANPVAEKILRQFQALCSDVRRTSEARCSSR